jgi:single-strand DNA-binding protein
MATINRVVLVGRLTRDPELRSTATGTSVCRLRLACNTSFRHKDTGERDERPNFFDVTVFGASGEACARFLTRGRPVAVDGRLEWHEWETADGDRRQSVGVLADSVQFLSSRQPGEGGDDPESATTEDDEEAIPF